MTSVHEFDDFIRDGNIWVKAVMDRLGTDDVHAAYLVLRATLHALRDRIPAESAVHLGAQLPTIIRGINDHQVGEIFRFAVDNIECVSAISYQPVSFTGSVP